MSQTSKYLGEYFRETHTGNACIWKGVTDWNNNYIISATSWLHNKAMEKYFHPLWKGRSERAKQIPKKTLQVFSDILQIKMTKQK